MKKLFRIFNLIRWLPIQAPREKEQHSVSLDPERHGVGQRADNNTQKASDNVIRKKGRLKK
jgi:hypothetical protein